MNKETIKAVVVFDRRASTWFSEKIIDEWSIDYHLMDAQDFLVDIEVFDRALKRRHRERELDAVLLDATLPNAFLLKMAMRVRDQIPGLPVLLLPQLQTDAGKAGSLAKNMREVNMRADLRETITHTLVRVIRYAHNRQRLQSKLLKMALKDDLTGLYNRRGFVALAKQHLRLARNMKRNLLLFFADLDGLKQINDQLGHHAGDQALILAAASLRKTFRKSDVIARLGGDEFVVLVTEDPAYGAETICERLQSNLTKCAARKFRCDLSMSVGVAHFNPEASVSLHDLMAQADAALYIHKRKTSSVSPQCLAINVLEARTDQQIVGALLSKRPVDDRPSSGSVGETWLSVPLFEPIIAGAPP